MEKDVFGCVLSDPRSSAPETDLKAVRHVSFYDFWAVLCWFKVGPCLRPANFKVSGRPCGLPEPLQPRDMLDWHYIHWIVDKSIHGPREDQTHVVSPTLPRAAKTERTLRYIPWERVHGDGTGNHASNHPLGYQSIDSMSHFMYIVEGLTKTTWTSDVPPFSAGKNHYIRM